jgi:hypothetical protein
MRWRCANAEIGAPGERHGRCLPSTSVAAGSIGGGIWRDEFCQAQNRGMIARFAFDFINAFPLGFFVGRRLRSG